MNFSPKLLLLVVTTVCLFACFVLGDDPFKKDEEILNQTMTDAQALIKDVRAKMEQFKKEKNYFASSIEKELQSFVKMLAHLEYEKNKEDLKSNDLFFKEFVYRAEGQVHRGTHRINILLELAKNGTDPTYTYLLKMIDDVKTRTLADIGKLVIRSKTEKAEGLKSLYTQMESLEQRLKSINFTNSPEAAANMVEKIVDLERLLQNELFKIEEDLDV